MWHNCQLSRPETLWRDKKGKIKGQELLFGVRFGRKKFSADDWSDADLERGNNFIKTIEVFNNGAEKKVYSWPCWLHTW